MRSGRSAVPIYLVSWFLALLLPALAGAQSPLVENCKESLNAISPADRLARCNGGFGDLPRLARIYEEKLDLPVEAAAALAGAMRDNAEATERMHRDGLPPRPAILALEAEFVLLLQQTPEKPALVDEVRDFYSAWEQTVETPSSSLLDRIEAAADPVALAARLTDLDGGDTDRPFFAEIALAALVVRPQEPALWERAAQLARHPAWKAVLFEQAYRVYLGPRTAAPRPEDLPTAARLAGEWLGAELAGGLIEEAVATYHALPANLRASLAEHREQGLLLSAAYLLTGDLEAADEVLGAGRPQESRETAGLLLRALHPTREDPFDLLTAAVQKRISPKVPTALAFARFAERERYPAFHTYFLRQVTGELEDLREPWRPQPHVPPALSEEAVRLEAALERTYRTASETIRTQTEAAPGEAALAQRLAALRAKSTLSPMPPPAFPERPLPAGVTPTDLPPERAAALRKALAADFKLPEGFSPLRAGREGQRVAVIGTLASYGWAYGVVLSEDGGRSWSAARYTGIGIDRPYRIHEASALPLLAGDRLQVEAGIEEPDPSVLYLGYGSLPTRPTGKVVYLEIPLADLTRDSDGDGLTDLEEGWFLTDPGNPDSDGDGIPDGADLLPHVPHLQSREAVATSAALAAVLVDLDRERTLTGRDCLVADRAPFGGLVPDQRLIVLTAEERKVLWQRFGYCELALPLFVLDRSGHRGFAIWVHSGAAGGTIRLEERSDEKAGGWIAQDESYWVS